MSLAAPAGAQEGAAPSAAPVTTPSGAFASYATLGWSWGSVELDLGLRPGFYGSSSREPDGSSAEKRDLRARAQLGIRWNASSVLSLRGRLAGRFSTDQDGVRFYVRDHLPTTDGLRPGEATIDELYVRWTPSDRFDIRAGRMQTRFKLVGVPSKSLDRNDSPSTDVTWTDGVHASVALGGGWRQHVILQRNGSRGPTNVVRSPLDVTGSASRVTLVAAVHNDRRSGPWVQRGVDVTYIPRSVPRPDDASSETGGARAGYLALVARAGLEPANALGGRIMLAGAVGFAPVTPPRSALGSGTVDDGDGDGLAFQVSANLMDVADVHSFGIVHLRAGDGWLISADVPPNSRDWEGRYYWEYAPWGRLDVRFRRRKELRARLEARDLRRKSDFFIRTTLQFGGHRAPSTSPSAAASGTTSRSR